jgi:hypothetical protein
MADHMQMLFIYSDLPRRQGVAKEDQKEIWKVVGMNPFCTTYPVPLARRREVRQDPPPGSNPYSS